MFKAGKIFLLICIIFSCLYGLLLAVSPGTIAGSTLEVRGVALENVKDTGLGQAFIVQSRHLGVMVVCVSIALFFVFFAAFSKGAQWVWWAILVVGGIGWIYGLIVQVLEGDQMNMILHIIGLVILAAGLLFTMKDSFAKEV